MNDGSPLSLVILYCVHWPTANGNGSNTPAAGAGTAFAPGCSVETRRSISALRAGSTEGPQAADATAATAANRNGAAIGRMAAMVPNRPAAIKLGTAGNEERPSVRLVGGPTARCQAPYERRLEH